MKRDYLRLLSKHNGNNECIKKSVDKGTGRSSINSEQLLH